MKLTLLASLLFAPMPVKSRCTVRQKNFGLIFLSTVFLSFTSGAQNVAADSSQLVLNADTGISLREGFDAELLYTVTMPQSPSGMCNWPNGRAAPSMFRHFR